MGAAALAAGNDVSAASVKSSKFSRRDMRASRGWFTPTQNVHRAGVYLKEPAQRPPVPSQKSGFSVCGIGSAPSAPNSEFGFSAQLASRMGPAREVDDRGLKGSVTSATP